MQFVVSEDLNDGRVLHGNWERGQATISLTRDISRLYSGRIRLFVLIEAFSSSVTHNISQRVLI